LVFIIRDNNNDVDFVVASQRYRADECGIVLVAPFKECPRLRTGIPGLQAIIGICKKTPNLLSRDCEI
jgi:hypothetical protein